MLLIRGAIYVTFRIVVYVDCSKSVTQKVLFWRKQTGRQLTRNRNEPKQPGNYVKVQMGTNTHLLLQLIFFTQFFIFISFSSFIFITVYRRMSYHVIYQHDCCQVKRRRQYIINNAKCVISFIRLAVGYWLYQITQRAPRSTS